MENNIKHYYFESDFKLVDLNVQEGVPFTFKYYVKHGGEVVTASYDGVENYTGCRPSEEVAGAIVVPFDGGKLGIGTLKVKRVYNIVDADMADGVFNSVTEKVLPIELWRGPSDDVAGDAVILYDSLYRGAPGKSAYQTWLDLGNVGSEQDFIDSLGGGGGGGSVTTEKIEDGAITEPKLQDGAVTEDKLSEEVKEKLNQQSGGYEPPEGGIPKADLSEEVQSSLNKADTALQEDSLTSYAKLSEVQEIADGLVTKDSHASDIQGLQDAIEEVESSMITAEPAEGEKVEDYVLMKSDVDEEIDSNSNNPVTNEAIARALEAAVARGRELANRDLYIAAGAEYNDTDSVIKKTAFWGAEVDNLPHHYYLNGLGDITEEEMEVIYKYKECMSIFLSSTDAYRSRFFQDGGFVPRTLFAAFKGLRQVEVVYIDSNSAANSFANCKNLKVIKWIDSKSLSTYGSSAIRTDYGLFFNCPSLEVIDVIKPNRDIKGSQCVNLVECRFINLDYNVILSTNRKISKESVLYMIQNVLKSTTKALVITLHADTYAKCIEGGEWHEEVQSALDTANAAITGGGSINIASA